MMLARETWAVVYRTGVPKRCAWRRVLEDFTTYSAAESQVERLGRMGYKALIFTSAGLAACGLPEGWEWVPGPKEAV